MSAQYIPEPVTNVSLYLFIDELALDGIIDLNGAVKPYDRKTILSCLEKALESEGSLTPRQLKEVRFYLADFGATDKPGKFRFLKNPAVARYADTLFSVTVSPILGLTAASDGSIAWKNGAKVYGSYGNWSFFAALQDNHQDPLTGKPEYLTRERGGHIKGDTDFSEMTGGAAYSWRWGNISLLKDSPVWGSGYAGSNILSGRAPSFMQLRLYLKPAKWAEMTWFHGWLTSMVVDSTRSYWVSNAYGTDYREVYHYKFFNSAMFTFIPVRNLDISIGNSIIYSDPRLTPSFLLPFYFYKSVDHGANSGIDNSNSQMFIDISSYNIKHLHLYGTLFIDELSTERFTNSEYNYFSWKGGFRTGNFPFLPNLWATAEFTFTYPLTFQHYVPTLTFENQGYNMGHYLRDNSRSLWLAVDYKPIRGLAVRLWHERSERGPDYQSLGGDRVGLPYMEPVEWKNIATGIEVSYMITGGIRADIKFVNSLVEGEESWTAPHLYGQTTTFSGGLVWGF
ncbi:MAG: capsule assembly Wzi family protein [Bacteroidales bacterium]|nr:capsule assembly Wzi family protein [Bacteroidales bacterium]